MGRLILISGENNSGKSVCAEKLTSRIGKDLYYIATMIPKTEHNHQRIAKHRKQREDYDFQTLELPFQVGDAAVGADSAVLLEDVSNLLANVIFETGGTGKQVFSDICALRERCDTLIAVTISDLDTGSYEGETACYIDALNHLNASLSELADIVIRMENRTPCVVKGEIALAD